MPHSSSHLLPVLTADSEGAAGQDLPTVVSHRVVALVRLRHPLGHPDLPTLQQPPPAHVVCLSVRSVPQHDRRGRRQGTTGRKLQQGAIIRDAVLKVFAIVSVVGLNAFWGRTEGRMKSLTSFQINI